MIVGITDRTLYENEQIYMDIVGKALQSNVIDYLILREPSLSYLQYEQFIRNIIKALDGYQDKMIIHTYEDIADKFEIKNVHLPEKLWKMKISNQGKAIWDNLKKYSTSIHNWADIQNSRLEKSEFYLVSPVYHTSCKPEAHPINLEKFQTFRGAVDSKMVLLGGLNLEKIKALKDEGFEHFAIRSGIHQMITQ